MFCINWFVCSVFLYTDEGCRIAAPIAAETFAFQTIRVGVSEKTTRNVVI